MASSGLRLVEGDFDSFFAVPFEVYDDDDEGGAGGYVSPLDDDLRRLLSKTENPFFAAGAGEGHFYTAVDERGRPRGRIVCHIHHSSNRRWNERAAMFGFFDCADDLAVAQALLDKAESHARAWGASVLRGNVNLMASQEMGVVTGGFENGPMVGLLWNPPHVPKLLAACGFRGVYPATTFLCRDVQGRDWDAMLTDKHKAAAADRSYTFRTVNMSEYGQEVQRIREVLNEAMHDNRLFVDITPAEMDFQLGPYEQFIDPRLVWIAEHKGEVVGATLATPDFLPVLRRMGSRATLGGLLRFFKEKREIKGATIIIIVVKKAFQAKGIIGVLNWKLLKALQSAGYTDVAGTWIADTNKPSLKQAQLMGFEKLHRCDLFEKQLR
jgi:GNAT superfamily N-acetyltransferase